MEELKSNCEIEFNYKEWEKERKQAEEDAPYRELHGKSMRPISIACHPYRIDIDRFCKEMKENIDGWKSNLIHLTRDPKYTFPKERHYIETWVESLLAWSEIEQE